MTGGTWVADDRGGQEQHSPPLRRWAPSRARSSRAIQSPGRRKLSAALMLRTWIDEPDQPKVQLSPFSSTDDRIDPSGAEPMVGPKPIGLESVGLVVLGTTVRPRR